MRLFTNLSPLPPSLGKGRGSKEREGFAPLKNSSLSHYKGERDTRVRG